MNRKIFLLAFFLLILYSQTTFAQHQEQYKMKCVVIDPGHGGHDSGAHYGKYKEKDIVLSVGLMLGKMINDKYPDIKVVYTRDKDVFIPLDQRGKIANEAKGDLFISIHVNSVGGAPSARGFETFTIGMHKNAANLEVAKKENSVITLEKDYEQNYEGFDPNDEESYIMFGLGQQAFQRQSLAISYEVQESYQKYIPSKNRGMKQAGFLVLWTTSMPSILTELGFISNASDRTFLCNTAGQKKIANALFEAFCKYKSGTEVVSVYNDSGVTSEKVDTTPTEVVEESPKDITEKDTYYSVQILVSSKNFSKRDSRFNMIGNQLFVIKDKKIYKYYVGKEVSYKEVLSLQGFLRNNGYKDAFVVAFKDNKQISVKELQSQL